MKPFFISTAIDYPSARFHLGHAYEKIIADSIARWHRLNGFDVHFSTGTDCHGLKIQRAAEKINKTPEVFVEETSSLFRQLCQELNISHDDFIMTTEKRHEKVVFDVIKKLRKKGEIHEGTYEGNYCVDCETFYTDKDLVDGCCPTHKTKKTERLKEKTYFFRMGKYQEKLIAHIKNSPESLWPEKKRHEMLNRLKDPLRDLVITREKVTWGIPFPLDKKLTVAIWVDALINYLSTVDYPNKKFKKFWPATHVIGPDIVWHHTILWWSMLFALGIKLPNVIVHGFINVGGEKMSKSAGLVVDPLEVAAEFSSDSLRYYLLREIPFGQDGEFSISALCERHNSELANGLGNLLNRTMALSEKKLGGKVPKAKTDSALAKKLNLKKITAHMDSLELHLALAEIFSFASACNKYVNDSKVWELEGKRAEVALYSLLDSLRVIALLLQPFIPQTSERIAKQLNTRLGVLKDAKFNLLKAGTKIGVREILFQKHEAPAKEQASSNAREVSVQIDLVVREKGLKLACAVIEGVSVKNKHESLEKKISGAVKALDLDAISKSPSVQGYLELYDSFSLPRQKHAVQNLIEIAKESGKLPRINTAVDSYNIVSLSRGLIVGAHDLDKVKGNVRVKISDGSEKYIPMGSASQVPVAKGEYVFVDDEIVLCRLDVKQGEQTKIINSTKNIFLYVQGNARTEQKELEVALQEICENIVKFCGGKVRRVEIK